MTRATRAWASRVAAVGAVAVAALLGLALPASAHPLGNFSVNVYNGIVVAPDEVSIDHVIDLAEVPTVQAMPQLDLDGDESVTASELSAFAQARCSEDVNGLKLAMGGQAVPLGVTASSAALADGQAGLSTVRIECSILGEVSLSESEALSFSDDSIAGELGWHEVTVQGDEVTIADANVPGESVSQALTSYPESQLDSPLRVSSASAQVTLGGAALGEADGGVATAGTSLNQSPWEWGSQLLGNVTATASGPIGMTGAVLIAVLVGALHAVAPGHGKSLVAFALAGRQQRAARAALTVGATVTITHTASVLVLGLLVAGTASVVPTSIYSVLGVVTGLVIVVLGLVLLRGALKGGGHGHSHDHGHTQGHSHGHLHGHGHGGDQPHSHAPHHHHSPEGAGAVAVLEHPHSPASSSAIAEPPTLASDASPNSRRGVLVTLGITGGLLPSPSAVVVLLAAAAAGRAWFGVLLVLAFGTGMALTLAGVGFAVLRGQQRILAIAERSPRPWLIRSLQVLPVVTAGAVVSIGVLLVVTAL